MKRMALFTQVMTVNAALAAVVALAASLVFDLEFSGPLEILAVAALAAAAGATVNLAILSGRFALLEELIDDMEKVDISRPGLNLPDSLDGKADSEEVERLELAFLRMLRRLEAERRRAGDAALKAQERERARVARDLHDEVNQSLTALLLRLEAIRERAPAELEEEISETRALASRAMQELLAMARQLRPTVLDDLGLEAAIGALVEEVSKGPIEADFEFEGDRANLASELPDEVQLVIYRVAQEALSNAARHSDAQRISVSLSQAAPQDVGNLESRSGAQLTVTDDGKGFSFEDSALGLGLEGMRERALLVGGSLDIESRPGYGTTVKLAV